MIIVNTQDCQVQKYHKILVHASLVKLGPVFIKEFIKIVIHEPLKLVKTASFLTFSIQSCLVHHYHKKYFIHPCLVKIKQIIYQSCLSMGTC